MSIREKYEQSLRNLLKSIGYSDRFKYREDISDDFVISDIIKIQASLVNIDKLTTVYIRINEFKDILASTKGENNSLVQEAIKSMTSIVEQVFKGKCLYDEGMTPDLVLDQIIEKINNTLTQVQSKQMTRPTCGCPERSAKTISTEHKEWKEKEAQYKESFKNLMEGMYGGKVSITWPFENPRNIEELKANVNYFIGTQERIAEFICDSHGFDGESMFSLFNEALKDGEDLVIKSKLNLIKDIITGNHLYKKGLSPFKLVEDAFVQLANYLKKTTDAKRPVMKSDDVIHDIKVCIKEQFKDLSELPDQVHLVLSKEEVHALINN